MTHTYDMVIKVKHDGDKVYISFDEGKTWIPILERIQKKEK